MKTIALMAASLLVVLLPVDLKAGPYSFINEGPKIGVNGRYVMLFVADFCQPCEVAKDTTGEALAWVEVINLSTSNDPRIAAFGIKAAPTYVCVERGKVLYLNHKPMTPQNVKDWLDGKTASWTRENERAWQVVQSLGNMGGTQQTPAQPRTGGLGACGCNNPNCINPNCDCGRRNLATASRYGAPTTTVCQNGVCQTYSGNRVASSSPVTNYAPPVYSDHVTYTWSPTWYYVWP
jgi:hypothetical protein